MIQELIDKYHRGEVMCLVDLSMNILSGKWKSIILWHLGEDKVLRYGELKRRLGRITPKMLIQQLRELEDVDMITRKEYHQIPPKVEYSLTPRGESILPLLEHMCRWSRENILGEKLP